MDFDKYIVLVQHPATFSKEEFGYYKSKAEIDEAPMSADGRRAAMAGLDAAYKSAKEKVRQAYQKEVAKIRSQFEEDVEVDLGFSHYSEKAKKAIHAKAWEDGHAYGYGEVYNCYPDILEFAEAILNQ